MRTLISLVLLITCSFVMAESAKEAKRLDDVAERGAHVMPFALDKTLHVFTKNASGGRQQVIAKNVQDSEQITLIQQHLSMLALKFAKGDFSGPKRIHGEAMPGLPQLAAGFSRVQFNYQALANGAQLDYVASEPELIDAIHAYFDAQLSDHARHAVSGHAMHH